MKIRITVCLLAFSLFISPLLQSQVQKIYLNPKAANSEKQSDFIDSIRFIPLEIGNELKNVSATILQVSERYLMILDYYDKALHIYTKEGRFLKKIEHKKLGEISPYYHKETNQVVFLGSNKNYSLTTEDQVKIKLDWQNPRNRKYYTKYIIDMNDPSYTLKKAVADRNDISYSYHFYDDFYIQRVIGTSPLYKDTIGYEFSIYKGDKLVKSFFPYNRVNEPRFLYSTASVSFNETDQPFINYVTRPYCDTIYKLIKDSLTPAYQLVLPLENTLPSSYLTRPFKNKTEWDNFNKNNARMLRQVHNFYENDKFVFLYGDFLATYEGYVYRKNSLTTVKAKNIRSDKSQYNLALLSEYNLERVGDWFYIPKKIGELQAFFKQNTDVPIPKDLESFLNQNPPADSPVVVAFKLKN